MNEKQSERLRAIFPCGVIRVPSFKDEREDAEKLGMLYARAMESTHRKTWRERIRDCFIKPEPREPFRVKLSSGLEISLESSDGR